MAKKNEILDIDDEVEVRKPKITKKKYKVVLVAPTFVVYDDNGNNRHIEGKFNVKKGDFIEI